MENSPPENFTNPGSEMFVGKLGLHIKLPIFRKHWQISWCVQMESFNSENMKSNFKFSHFMSGLNCKEIVLH